MGKYLSKFNDILKQLPWWKAELIDAVKASDLEEGRKANAVKFLEKAEFKMTGHLTIVTLQSVNHVFSYSECSLKNGQENELGIYVRTLIEDINTMSEKFDISIVVLRFVPGGCRVCVMFDF